MEITRKNLVRIIDSTNVRMTANKREIQQLCKDALQYNFGCVCVNPNHVKLAAKILQDSEVKVSSTVGFPFGVSLSETKAMEALRAYEDGAREIDMVASIGMLKSGDIDYVKEDIASVTEIKRLDRQLLVKVIFEMPHLSKKEKILACKITEEAKADFIKTSTGFFGLGATADDVDLIRKTVGERIGVKAAGGIRNYRDAIRMIKAGASRIGTSTAVKIADEAPS